ncbi:MAG: hypothetical protein RBU37_22180 [Myxococcota bacterium]|jgi:hypothetical protein|nr:hypothetical protein [Myxococcota bacterium]
MPCFAERLRRQGFLLGRFAIVVDAEGRFADSINRMGRSYLRLELSDAERRCVAEGLAELALPPAPESWAAIVEFNDPAVLRSDEKRASLPSVRQQYCEGPLALSDFDCAARYVVYEPDLGVRLSQCSVESCQPLVEALRSRLPLLSHCIWFTHDEPQLAGSLGLSLVFEEGGSLIRATQKLGETGQAPNRQELGETGQAPNRQELGETGQAPNRQEPSLTADSGLSSCLVAAFDGLRSGGPLEMSLVVEFGQAGEGASFGPR